MKLIHVAIWLWVAASIAQAQEWTNSPKEAVKDLTENLVIPNIDYSETNAIEILEFVRMKIWRISFSFSDPVRPAHEYRCNPDKLLKTVTLKRKGISYGKVLDEICGGIDVSWRIEKGKIVFEEPAKKQNKSEQGVEPDAGDAPE